MIFIIESRFQITRFLVSRNVVLESGSDSGTRVWAASNSVDGPWLAPADMDQFRCCDACKTGSIAAGGKHNEAPIISVASCENLSSDRNAGQSAINRQQLDLFL